MQSTIGRRSNACCLTLCSFLLWNWFVPQSANAQCEFTGAGLAQSSVTPPVQGEIQSIKFSGVGTDRLELEANLRLLSNIDVELQQVTLDRIRINDVPFYAFPLTQPVTLKKDVANRLPETLKLTVYFRDVDSLKPLVSILTDERVHVESTLRFKVPLNPIQQIASFSRRASVVIPVGQDLSVEVPGGAMSRRVAIEALQLADAGLQRVRTAADAGLNALSSERVRLKRSLEEKVLLTIARFDLVDSKGTRASFECLGQGFRIDPQRFVVQKAAFQPWKFEPEIAAALQSGGMRFDSRSYEVETHSALNDQVFSLKRGQIQLVKTPKDQLESVWVKGTAAKPAKIKLHQRKTPANLGLFEFAGKNPGPAKIESAQSDSLTWDRVVIYRSGEVLYTTASRLGSRIVLKTPVDDGALGSPLIADEGIIGILQASDTGLTMTEVRRALKLN